MSTEFQPEKKRSGFASFWIIVLLIILIGSVLFFVSPTNERAYVSSNLARIRANILIQKIPLPDGTERLASRDSVIVYSKECYQGEARVLLGTNLDIDIVRSFYKTFFADWGWKVANSKTKYPSFGTDSRFTEGVRFHYCDQTCFSYFDIPTTVIQTAQEKYENFYLISTWYVPIESRSNPWCANYG